MTDQKFKVGDKVWCMAHGWGIIKEICKISKDNPYPRIYACFDNANLTYLTDGKREQYDANPTLLTIEEAAKFGIYPIKKKKTVTIKYYANIMQDCEKNYYLYNYFSSKEAAESEKYPREKLVAAAVPYEITFQVDEE